jgi:hypothetical protein
MKVEKESPLRLPISKQEDCLRELKNAGATPREMIAYGLLIFAMPSMVRSLAWLVLGCLYFGALNK